VKILIDMNLSPEWVALLLQNGHEALHWSSIGRHNAPDSEIMQWARENRAVVFTHDLDFGILLSHTQAGAPSVVQVRTQNVTTEHLGSILLEVLSTHREVIEAGALITVDEARARVRILPV
jgi:predicted nuclease of predicted toxin-antitoxin system